MAIAVSGNNQAQAQSGIAGKHGKHCRHGKHGKHGKAGKAGKHAGIGQPNFASALHSPAAAGSSMALAVSGNSAQVSQLLSSLLGGGQNQANAGMNPGLGGMLRSFSSVGF
ncbi:MAG: hypothetical protein KF760_29655 [Candidatus Eremiobacteraeota bacterium]|nr:hypothetical protein [Candidatus Eremiobacteraeota bacterium]